MLAAEILRKFADALDAQEQGCTEEPCEPQPCDAPQQSQHQPNDAALRPATVDNTDKTEKQTFISPIQSEIEFLKKAAGLDGCYAQAGRENPPKAPLSVIKIQSR